MTKFLTILDDVIDHIDLPGNPVRWLASNDSVRGALLAAVIFIGGPLVVTAVVMGLGMLFVLAAREGQ